MRPSQFRGSGFTRDELALDCSWSHGTVPLAIADPRSPDAYYEPSDFGPAPSSSWTPQKSRAVSRSHFLTTTAPPLPRARPRPGFLGVGCPRPRRTVPLPAGRPGARWLSGQGPYPGNPPPWAAPRVGTRPRQVE